MSALENEAGETGQLGRFLFNMKPFKGFLFNMKPFKGFLFNMSNWRKYEIDLDKKLEAIENVPINSPEFQLPR